MEFVLRTDQGIDAPKHNNFKNFYLRNPRHLWQSGYRVNYASMYLNIYEVPPEQKLKEDNEMPNRKL